MTDERDRECPSCDSSLPAEFDPVLRVFVCSCCSTTWKPRPRREPPEKKRAAPQRNGRPS